MNAIRNGWCALALSVMTSALLVACGDDDEDTPRGAGAGSAGGQARGGEGGSDASQAGVPSEPQAGEPSEPSAGAGGAGEAAEAGAVYALATQVFGESDSQSYVLLTNTLDADTELSVDDAWIEVPGRALAAGVEGEGALFVASDQGPTVTRYELTEDDGLEAGKSLSFLAAGVSKFGEYSSQFQFVSKDKAYWFDGSTSQVVVWDPTAMKVLDTIPLTELAAQGQLLSFTTAPVWRGETLYMFAAWREGLIITPRAAVVALDTSTDSVTIVEDTRCGYVRDGVLTDDGFIYMASEAFGSAANWLDQTNPSPCLLRFDTAAQQFDADYHVELSTLVDGAAAGSLVVGPDNRAFLRVLDGRAAPDGVTNPRVLASAPAWRWVSLTLGDEPKTGEVAAPLSSGSVLRFELGERIFAPLFVAATTTTFLELTTEGPAQSALSVPGLVFSAVKLR
jgi:hypothetical protein